MVFILDACHSGGSGKLLGHIKYEDSSNIIFIGASRFSEKAYESAEIEQSRFTLAFLESFSQTPNLDDWLTLQQTLAYVDQMMPEIAKEKRQQSLEITSHAKNQNIKLVQNPRFSIDAVEFIDEVKELCELSDGSIVEGLRDLPDNIFIMTERKAFGTQNATLIGCFYNAVVEISDREIEQFNKVEEEFSTERSISSALIISKKELSHLIKDKFNKLVDFRTLNQMIWQLVDFQRYLSDLRREYKQGNKDRPQQPPLKEIYIPLSGHVNSSQNSETSEAVVQVDLAIENWLKAKNQPIGMLLGSYGTGKTTVARVVSSEQAELLQDRTNKDSRIPVIFPLRLFPKYSVVEIDGFIVSYLRKFPGLKNIDFDAFQKMNHSGKLLLIFDGFDEMGTRVDRDILKRNFTAICSLINSGREKIIVSSRPEVFLTDTEQKEILSTLENRYPITTFHLHPLSDDQFKQYVKKRVKYLQRFDDSLEDWATYHNQITDIPELKEIATRPVILEITISTLPTLIKEDVKISKANLYEHYLGGEIDRQVVDKGRDFLIGRNQRLDLIQFVAVYLLAKDQIELSAEEISNVINANLLPEQKVDVEAFTRDFLACSFMLREVQSYRFSHLSFLEYLVARTLVSEIQSNKPYILDNIVIKTEIAHFLVELIKNSSNPDSLEQILWDWVNSSAREYKESPDVPILKERSQERSFKLVKVSRKEDISNVSRHNLGQMIITGEGDISRIISSGNVTIHISGPDTIAKETYAFENLFRMRNSTSFVGGNSLTFLSLLEKFPEKHNYDSFNLSGASINELDFIESSFKGTIVREGRFTKSNFLNSKLDNADFRKSGFGDSLIDIREIPNCNFRECQFGDVTFNVQTLSNCDFRECQFGDVTFNVQTLSNCSFRGCQFGDVTFNVQTLSNCDFRESQFGDVKFRHGSIILTIFESAKFKHIQFTATLIEECDFKDATLSDVLFEQSTIKRSNFSTITSEDNFYEECQLEGCFFPVGYTINSEKGVTITNEILVSADELVIRQSPTESKPRQIIMR